MDAKIYLQSYGWQEGEALKHGGLKKPILVKHKKDTKGLGHDTNDADMWWERLFDGQLKNLEVSSGSGGVSFEQNQEKVRVEVARASSPLYRMFIKGAGLAGTVGTTRYTEVEDKVDYKGALRDTEKRVLAKSAKVKKKKDGRLKRERKERKEERRKRREKKEKRAEAKHDKAKRDKAKRD